MAPSKSGSIGKSIDVSHRHFTNTHKSMKNLTIPSPPPDLIPYPPSRPPQACQRTVPKLQDKAVSASFSMHTPQYPYKSKKSESGRAYPPVDHWDPEQQTLPTPLGVPTSQIQHPTPASTPKSEHPKGTKSYSEPNIHTTLLCSGTHPSTDASIEFRNRSSGPFISSAHPDLDIGKENQISSPAGLFVISPLHDLWSHAIYTSQHIYSFLFLRTAKTWKSRRRINDLLYTSKQLQRMQII